MNSLTEILRERVFIVAEIGNNHNGSKDAALQLIDLAAEAGADAVKFQTFTGLDIVSPKVRADEYKGWDVKGYTYWHEFLDTISLKLSDHQEVYEYAHQKGLVPFSTPTSPRMVDFLETLGNEIYKIASMDLTNIPLLTRVARTSKPVILSTGMASEEEIQRAINILDRSELVLLHCISDYPTLAENVNLFSIRFLEERFNLFTGFSDHTITNEFALASIPIGAKVIEKHITYSRNATEKAEHHFSLEVREFAEMVRAIRNIEKGMGEKILYRSNTELDNKSKYRRGLHLNKDMKAGQLISDSDLAIVRPVIGADASDFDLFLGKRLRRDVDSWTGLNLSDVTS